MLRTLVMMSLAVAAMPASALAGAAEDCNQVQDLRRRIKGCTEFLSQSSSNPKNGADAKKRAALAHMSRGYAFSQLGRRDLAVADYSEAIELEPRNVQFRFRRGELFAIAHAFERAEADFDKISEIDPKSPLADRGRGLAFYHRRNFADAVAALDEAARKDPNYAWTFYLRGHAKWALGRPQEAANDLEKAVELDRSSKQRDARFPLSRGQLHVNQDKFDEAMRDFGEALKINPRSADALVARGNLLVKQGKIEEAVADFDKAIASDPLNAAAYEGRGRPVADQFDKDGSIPDLDGAIEAPREQGL